MEDNPPQLDLVSSFNDPKQSGCEKCNELTSKTDEMVTKARFLMSYLDGIDDSFTIKACLEKERDQLKRQLEEKDTYIEAKKREICDLHKKLIKSLEDKEKMILVQKESIDLLKKHNETVEQISCLRATNDQVNHWAKQKHEEAEQVRLETKNLTKENADLSARVKQLIERIEKTKSKEKDDRILISTFRKALELIKRLEKLAVQVGDCRTSFKPYVKKFFEGVRLLQGFENLSDLDEDDDWMGSNLEEMVTNRRVSATENSSTSINAPTISAPVQRKRRTSQQANLKAPAIIINGDSMLSSEPKFPHMPKQRLGNKKLNAHKSQEATTDAHMTATSQKKKIMQDWMSSNAAAPPAFKKPVEASARPKSTSSPGGLKVPPHTEILKTIRIFDRLSPMPDRRPLWTPLVMTQEPEPSTSKQVEKPELKVGVISDESSNDEEEKDHNLQIEETTIPVDLPESEEVLVENKIDITKNESIIVSMDHENIQPVNETLKVEPDTIEESQSIKIDPEVQDVPTSLEPEVQESDSDLDQSSLALQIDDTESELIIETLSSSLQISTEPILKEEPLQIEEINMASTSQNNDPVAILMIEKPNITETKTPAPVVIKRLYGKRKRGSPELCEVEDKSHMRFCCVSQQFDAEMNKLPVRIVQHVRASFDSLMRDERSAQPITAAKAILDRSEKITPAILVKTALDSMPRCCASLQHAAAWRNPAGAALLKHQAGTSPHLAVNEKKIFESFDIMFETRSFWRQPVCQKMIDRLAGLLLAHQHTNNAALFETHCRWFFYWARKLDQVESVKRLLHEMCYSPIRFDLNCAMMALASIWPLGLKKCTIEDAQDGPFLLDCLQIYLAKRIEHSGSDSSSFINHTRVSFGRFCPDLPILSSDQFYNPSCLKTFLQTLDRQIKQLNLLQLGLDGESCLELCQENIFAIERRIPVKLSNQFELCLKKLVQLACRFMSDEVVLKLLAGIDSLLKLDGESLRAENAPQRIAVSLFVIGRLAPYIHRSESLQSVLQIGRQILQHVQQEKILAECQLLKFCSIWAMLNLAPVFSGPVSNLLKEMFEKIAVKDPKLHLFLMERFTECRACF